MKNLKVIKTQEDYQKALAAIDKILAIAVPTPDHLDELELLSILVEDYESKTMPVDLPDPIEAIKFRMEQDGLTRKDLQKYIGSASKVSEVLNRKVDLSLKMMRALHEGLGIPAEVLMQEPGKSLPAYVHMADQYPFKEMFKNGYFDPFVGTLNEAKEKASKDLKRAGKEQNNQIATGHFIKFINLSMILLIFSTLFINFTHYKLFFILKLKTINTSSTNTP